MIVLTNHVLSYLHWLTKTNVDEAARRYFYETDEHSIVYYLSSCDSLALPASTNEVQARRRSWIFGADPYNEGKSKIYRWCSKQFCHSSLHVGDTSKLCCPFKPGNTLVWLI